MAQRGSGYDRRKRDDYPTPPWVTRIIAAELNDFDVSSVWDPAAGNGRMVRALRREGFNVVGSNRDFLTWKNTPKVDAICTNPPYGGGGRLATQFIQHALDLDVDVVAMLLPIDFDSGSTRVHLFRDCRWFYKKIVLLNRISWFAGGTSPSVNHCWMIWCQTRDYSTPYTPTIEYAAKESESNHEHVARHRS